RCNRKYGGSRGEVGQWWCGLIVSVPELQTKNVVPRHTHTHTYTYTYTLILAPFSQRIRPSRCNRATSLSSSAGSVATYCPFLPYLALMINAILPSLCPFQSSITMHESRQVVREYQPGSTG
ncbi:hypothetical protein LOAG_10031, partial [Loa loa]